MEIIITYLAIISFSLILASHIDSLEWIKRKLGIAQESTMYSKLFVINTFIQGIKKLLNCPGCISFWTTLIYLGFSIEVLKIALIIYIITYVLDSKINRVYL